MVMEKSNFIFFCAFVFCLPENIVIVHNLEANTTTKAIDVRNYDEYTFNYNPVNFALADVKPDQISFRLFSKNYSDGIYLQENITEVNIDRNIPTKLVIHGWFENETVEWYSLIKNEFFKRGDYNVIFVDWRIPASREFSISAANTKPIGFLVANQILILELNLEKVHLIGHSFGSHIAGFAGKRIYEETGLKIRRITATDPAREEFEHDLVGLDKRLSEYDADIVDAIHTDSSHYGFTMPIGTVDFYFNGGRNQNGCPPLAFDDNCSHIRSNYYFAESINNNNFLAVKCDFSLYIFEHSILPFDTVAFGEDMIGFPSGTYCLSTSDKPPYALG